MKRLTLLEPDFLIEINKAGTINLEFETTQEPENETSEEEAIALFAFKEVYIQNAKVTVKDHKPNTTWVIHINRWTMKAPEFGDPNDWQMKGADHDIPFQLSGTVGPLYSVFNPDELWPLNLTLKTLDTNLKMAGSIQEPLEMKEVDLTFSMEGKELRKFQKKRA